MHAFRSQAESGLRRSWRGTTEVLAANLTQVVVVAAPRPDPDPFLVDRYLAAAEMMGVSACIAYNKIDIDPDCAEMDLKEYSAIGYPVIPVSAKTKTEARSSVVRTPVKASP